MEFPKFVCELKILTVTSLYIFEILCFIIKNKIYTTQYSDVHYYNTIHNHSLYIQFCNAEYSKRGVISMVIKIVNGIVLYCIALYLSTTDHF
jgi:hypothetical protein